tara:strand:+ start:2867 stop:3376 length:510 start_codon:yes stop_codon:yes gene_type:complete
MNKPLLKNKIVLLFLFIVALPIAFSHLDAGEDKEIDDFLIDFGYSPENPNTNDNVAIALTLFDKNQEVIEPTSVWVRISSPKDVVFAGTLKPNNGNVAFTYKFPYADNYDITARFNDDKETIVETDFNIKITETVPVYYYFFGIVVILIIIFVIIKLKALSKKLKKLDK